MKSHTFQLPIIHDEDEVVAIETNLSRINGVRTIEGDCRTKIFAITWEDPATWNDIEDTLVRMGYSPKYK